VSDRKRVAVSDLEIGLAVGVGEEGVWVRRDAVGDRVVGVVDIVLLIPEAVSVAVLVRETDMDGVPVSDPVAVRDREGEMVKEKLKVPVADAVGMLPDPEGL